MNGLAIARRLRLRRKKIPTAVDYPTVKLLAALGAVAVLVALLHIQNMYTEYLTAERDVALKSTMRSLIEERDAARAQVRMCKNPKAVNVER